MTEQQISADVIRPPAAIRPLHKVDRLDIPIPVWTVTLGMLILMAIAFWSALGLRATSLIEDWSFYAAFDHLGISRATLFISSQPDRPFLLLVYAIGYWLTPDSFMGLQLLGILFFIGTGMAMYAVVRQLWPKNPAVAVSAALLLVIFPADSGWFNTRYYSYTLALAAFLIALALFLSYWRHPRWWLIPGIWGGLLLCLGSYETAYPLIILTPVLLIWLNDGLSRRVMRQVIRTAGLIWFPVPLVMLIYSVYALSRQPTYQGNLLNSDSGGIGTRLLTYAYYDLRAFYRMFVQGWADIVHNALLRADSYFTAASVLTGLIVLIGLLVLWRVMTQNPPPEAGSAESTAGSANEPDQNRIRVGWRRRLFDRLSERRAWLILFAIGLFAIGLGFLLYLPIPNHRVFTDRVYMFSSIGGALCVSLLIDALSAVAGRWRSAVFAILFGGVFGIAALGATGLAVGLHFDSGQEQMALAQFAKQAPTLPNGAVVLVFDDTRTLTTNQWRFGLTWYSYDLEAATKYFYHQPNIGLRLCYPDRGVWGQSLEQCTLTAIGVQLSFNGQTQTVPYTQIVAFRYDPEQGYQLLSVLPYIWQTPQNASAMATYNPYALIDRTATPPPRVYTMLESWPYVPFVPQALIARHAVAINFEEVNASHAGETFNYPLLSDGWTASWNMATTASIHIHLAQGTDYHVSFHAIGAMSSQIMGSVALVVNGQPIHVGVDDASYERGVTFGAILRQPVINLNPTDTVIAFQTSTVVSPASLGLSADQRTLGVNIDWLHIDPLPPGTAP